LPIRSFDTIKVVVLGAGAIDSVTATLLGGSGFNGSAEELGWSRPLLPSYL